MSEITEVQDKILKECKQRGWIARKTQHHVRGWPDLEVFMPDGKHMIIECKSKGGKLEALQKEWIERLGKLGHNVHVFRDVEEFKQEVNDGTGEH